MLLDVSFGTGSQKSAFQLAVILGLGLHLFQRKISFLRGGGVKTTTVGGYKDKFLKCK